ncbi:MAG: DoxX family protein [Alphaproteobacteria bacterium]|jgi:putative oxidoreductase|nr:DoxX family protein [Alphaproteobacteria bacterium]
MNDTDEPKLVLPFLKPFYDLVIPLSWPLVRCSVGVILAVHGWGKVTRVMDLIAGNPTRGSAVQIVILMLVEFVGGICISLGLFTRFFAPAAAIEMGYLTFVRYADHFGWRTDGYEYVLMWGLILFAVSLRGGGPYSLDRKIGWSL